VVTDKEREEISRRCKRFLQMHGTVVMADELAALAAAPPGETGTR